MSIDNPSIVMDLSGRTSSSRGTREALRAGDTALDVRGKDSIALSVNSTLITEFTQNPGEMNLFGALRIAPHHASTPDNTDEASDAVTTGTDFASDGQGDSTPYTEFRIVVDGSTLRIQRRVPVDDTTWQNIALLQ